MLLLFYPSGGRTSQINLKPKQKPNALGMPLPTPGDGGLSGLEVTTCLPGTQPLPVAHGSRLVGVGGPGGAGTAFCGSGGLSCPEQPGGEEVRAEASLAVITQSLCPRQW